MASGLFAVQPPPLRESSQGEERFHVSEAACMTFSFMDAQGCMSHCADSFTFDSSFSGSDMPLYRTVL